MSRNHSLHPGAARAGLVRLAVIGTVIGAVSLTGLAAPSAHADGPAATPVASASESAGGTPSGAELLLRDASGRTLQVIDAGENGEITLDTRNGSYFLTSGPTSSWSESTTVAWLVSMLSTGLFSLHRRNRRQGGRVVSDLGASG